MMLGSVCILVLPGWYCCRNVLLSVSICLGLLRNVEWCVWCLFVVSVFVVVLLVYCYLGCLVWAVVCLVALCVVCWWMLWKVECKSSSGAVVESVVAECMDCCVLSDE